MKKLKIISVVGARPNFMKIAPIHRAFVARPEIVSKIVHTGQHYDAKMSDIFFNQLQLPKPDYYLGIGGGSHAHQKANVMLKFEAVLLGEQPDVVLVVGDVNATAACSITAAKMNIPTVHVESGLRSWDRTMPEEINRIITDAVSDHLFVTEQSGINNLMAEGVPPHKVHFVGNVMIDSLIHYRQKASELDLKEITQAEDILEKKYVLMTMHRPQNVDDKKSLVRILQIIEDSMAYVDVVFAVHPRTENNLKKFELWERIIKMGYESEKNLYLLPPQGYLEFLKLMDSAKLIITDSGGIQEETTYLQIPCLTFRSTTERPVTVELGTNELLADLNPDTVHRNLIKILSGDFKKGVIPPLWDGNAAERITQVLLNKYLAF